jgi:hypothetical protein
MIEDEIGPSPQQEACRELKDFRDEIAALVKEALEAMTQNAQEFYYTGEYMNAEEYEDEHDEDEHDDDEHDEDEHDEDEHDEASSSSSATLV